MDIKKEFQKTVGENRKDWRVKRKTPKGEYPKAMMTSQQMDNGTATVNCGGDFCSFSRELAEYVMNDSRFQKFLAEAGAMATIEKFYHYSCPAYQVRIRFAE